MESGTDKAAVRFWKDKRVFLTGHTGFKGSWLALWLSAMGARITGFSLPPPTIPSLFESARVSERLARHVEGDIRDSDFLRAAMCEAEPEILFHLAAQPLVRESYRLPIDTYAINVMGTVHVLEAARAIPSLRAAVCVTSDKCYENREWDWGYRENDAMGGADPYSSSKGCAELVVSAYRRSFFPVERHSEHGVAIASARAGNVIGGGDWALDRLVPDIIRALRAEVSPILRNPDAIRPWQHVLDALAGYLLLAECLAGNDGARYADGWNFGPSADDARSVRWIAGRLFHLWGKETDWSQEQKHQPHEAGTLTLDSAKARKRLDWTPRWNLDAALREIIAFAKADEAHVDMQDTVLRHIQLYERGLAC